MSTHVVVIATDLRRATVKVTPMTYMIDVLEEACKKLNIPNDRYLLKHKNKQLNLSDPFRVAALPPGAKLDLIVKSNSPAVVTIALKLPESESSLGIPNNRLTEKVRSDTSLWQLLRQFESTSLGTQKQLNITARGIPQTSNGAASGSGQLFWETPVLQVIGRELSTLEQFQRNLSQIGINSGNHLVQLSFKRTEIPLHAAMQEVERYFKDVVGSEASVASTEDNKPGEREAGPTIPKSTATTESHNTGPERANLANENAREEQLEQNISPAEVQTKPTASKPLTASTVAADPLQPTEVFSPSSSATLAAAKISEPDSSFVPTTAHAKLHQSHLEQRSQNKKLKSDKELAAEAAAQEARLSAIKGIEVRVSFPDRFQTKWTFGHDATGATLYEAVRNVMRHPDQPFKLTLPLGGLTIRDSGATQDNLIRGYGLRNTQMFFSWDETVPAVVRNEPSLKQAVAQAAHEATPTIPQYVEEDEDGGDAPKPPPAKRSGGKDGDGMGKKLPKWLKLPGKK